MSAKKRKPKPFRAATAVKAAARRKVGTPPPTRTAPSKKKGQANSPKHKPTLGKLLDNEG